MILNPVNFLTHIKNIVVGDRGFFRSGAVSLGSVSPVITDNTTGTPSATFAAGVGVSQVALQIDLVDITGAGDVLTTYTPGYRFAILALDFIVGTPVTTASDLASLNAEIGTTNLTGGVVALTSANCTPLGAEVAGTAVTAANTGSSTDTISIEASAVTAFAEGSGTLYLTVQNLDTADAFASLAARYLTADETNARVLLVEETVDSVAHVVWHVPLDYDERNDDCTVRVLASQLTLSTDNDVELDMEVYRKRPGAALSADLGPAAPGTVLTVAEQWVELAASDLGFQADDVIIFEIITNGANDTDGEEVLIHAVDVTYRSTLVKYADSTR